MKSLIQSLTVGFCLVAASLVAQDNAPAFKSFSAGVRALHLYDLPSYRFDDKISRDLQGLKGSHTSFDVGLDAYVEKQFTPLLGLQGGFRLGSMTGANEVEHYENSFHEAYLDLVLLMSNLDRSRLDASFNYYAKLGLGTGSYQAERKLNFDGSPNGSVHSGFWEGRIGAGVQYELTQSLRLEIEAAYNAVYDDGFDGYDNSTGSDPYFSTGIGVAYTFGKADKKPMYSVNYFGNEYSARMAQQELPAFDAEDKVKLEAYMQKMERYKAHADSTMEWQSSFIKEVQKLVEKQSAVIEEQAASLTDQTAVVNELQAVLNQHEQRVKRLEELAGLLKNPDFQSTMKMLAVNAQTYSAEAKRSAAESSPESLQQYKNEQPKAVDVPADVDISDELMPKGEITASLTAGAAVSVDSREEVQEVIAYFGFDSDHLEADFRHTLQNRLADKRKPVVLVAYADAIGDDDYNEKLKARRAKAVKEFLVGELMCDPEKIEIEIAEKQPDLGSDNHLNRKVVVRF